ncbi:aminopeptidase N [Methylocystis sp. MJC1]|jgi:aminopeptidase N|uniref:aminopeptidase N n=1 Tax=Methylocystis sp. MJC1 TaxID=2654282 RepID=UPI0013EC344A|nr:aminopeptidase N [Methylocystis sp. MJC1]KAF2992626.1 Aminopeptidase N [Methylocystis sp. MJC1]MBU6526593.1 aminopeptidase N [Methylocystis sp. MJC1]UZX13038.1 aminopeptidase N [Methylocystis sp. MJC1]
MRHPSNVAVRLADYRPADFLIDTVALDISLHRTETKVVARLALRRDPKGAPGAPLVLDGDELTLVSVKLDGRPLAAQDYTATPDQLALTAVPDAPFTLEIETRVDPTANTQLSGLYRSGSAYCTQCEAEGFRRITYFLDRPDVLSVYTTRVEADKSEAPILLSNGNPGETRDLPGGRHFAVWHDPFPKPSYLFALVGGDLGVVRDRFKTMSGRQVALAIHVEHGKEARAEYAMDALKRSMRWDEEKFSREYDLEVFNIVAVSDFNMGAMENKGLNIFNDKYVLASPETATDVDYAGIEAVIAHEYFHNWTGNRITCRDWFQLCLKEGLTVFRDQEFSADMRSRAVERIGDVRGLRLAQFPEDAGPLAHPVRPEVYHEINNFYTATVYEKGAEIVRMLRTLIGDDAFRRGMDIYFARFDGTAATVEDFLSCFAEASGRDLSHFALWYSQAGTPVLSTEGAYDADAKTFALTLRQEIAPTPGQQEKKPAVIPVALALFGQNGEKLDLESADARPDELTRGLFELSDTARTVTFQNIPSQPVVSALRGFSAPVRLEPAPESADLEKLLACDDDPFNRWQAAQSLALRAIFARVDAARAGAPLPSATGYVAALRTILSGADADPAFAAQALSLPSETDLARETGSNVDPDELFAARFGLREEIGRALLSEAASTYTRLADAGPYSPDAASAGRRSLKAVALDLVAAGDPAKGSALAESQFAAAGNMTDRLSALALLALLGGDAREKAFAAFYEQFAGDALVIDKWFALQATIPEPATTQRVIKLMSHPDFALTNPNRVRSLIGVFANANPTRFHALDGSGYDLLTKIVLELDPRNPQVAARLLSSLRSWRTMEPRRRAMIEERLRRIVAQEGLSADTKDIGTRALA